MYCDEKGDFITFMLTQYAKPDLRRWKNLDSGLTLV